MKILIIIVYIFFCGITSFSQVLTSPVPAKNNPLMQAELPCADPALTMIRYDYLRKISSTEAEIRITITLENKGTKHFSGTENGFISVILDRQYYNSWTMLAPAHRRDTLQKQGVIQLLFNIIWNLKWTGNDGHPPDIRVRLNTATGPALQSGNCNKSNDELILKTAELNHLIVSRSGR